MLGRVEQASASLARVDWLRSPQPLTMVCMTTALRPGVLELNGQPLSLDQISQVASGFRDAAIATAARPRIAASQAVVERIVTSNETAYGINTGFGKLSDVRIGAEDLQQLQRNLVRSHACGLGDPLEEAEVRAMLLLRANVLSKGLSGVRFELIDLLIAVGVARIRSPLRRTERLPAVPGTKPNRYNHLPKRASCLRCIVSADRSGAVELRAMLRVVLKPLLFSKAVGCIV